MGEGSTAAIPPLELPEKKRRLDRDRNRAWRGQERACEVPLETARAVALRLRELLSNIPK